MIPVVEASVASMVLVGTVIGAVRVISLVAMMGLFATLLVGQILVLVEPSEASHRNRRAVVAGEAVARASVLLALTALSLSEAV